MAMLLFSEMFVFVMSKDDEGGVKSSWGRVSNTTDKRRNREGFVIIRMINISRLEHL